MKALGKQKINFYAYLTVGALILAFIAALGLVSIESITEAVYAIIGLLGAVIALYKSLTEIELKRENNELKRDFEKKVGVTHREFKLLKFK
jgi:threonine/homoserine/homoserine lactone efflux protein